MLSEAEKLRYDIDRKTKQFTQEEYIEMRMIDEVLNYVR